MWLLQMDDEDAADVIDNKLYVLPPGKPVEMPDFDAGIMMAHNHQFGIVQVRETRDDEGIHLHTAEARVAAKALLVTKDNEIVAEYIRVQLEDRVKAGRPALPPSGRCAKVVKRSGTKLADYGVKPVGWVMDPSAAAAPADVAMTERIAHLEAQLTVLTKALAAKVETDLAPAAPPPNPPGTLGSGLEEAEAGEPAPEPAPPEVETSAGAGRISTDEPDGALQYEVMRAFKVGGTKYKKGEKVRLPLEIAEGHFDKLLLVEAQ
jgi:hypothetical protein